MDKKQTFSLLYVLLALLVIVTLQDFIGTKHTQTLSYSEFKQALTAGKLDDIVLREGVVTGRLNPEGLETVLPAASIEAIKKKTGEHRFTTVLLNDPGLIAQLDASKVRYAGALESKWLGLLVSWVAPTLIFVGIWFFAMKRIGGGLHGGMLEIGKSKARVYMQTETGVTFKDVAGIDEAKEELIEVVEFLKNPDRYKRLGGKIPKGVLIVGAPGTGKTLLAKAVAGEAGVPFLSLSGSGFVEKFVGVGAARVRDLFEQAAAKAPCIVFIDELDALGKARGISALGGGNDEREQTLNQLLVQMDGFDTNRGVIILATTNRPEILDPALLRAGRFDRHVTIDKPDLKGRRQILEVHVKHVTLAPEVDLGSVAARTPGFAGADLANLVNEATLRAAKRGKDSVDMQDFEDALDRIVALGLATYDTRPAALYLDGPALPEQRNCSERTAEVIDSEVRRLLDEARERVSITLTAHRATLEALAAELLEKEVVDRKMLDDLLRATLPAPPAAAAPGTAANTNTNTNEVTP